LVFAEVVEDGVVEAVDDVVMAEVLVFTSEINLILTLFYYFLQFYYEENVHQSRVVFIRQSCTGDNKRKNM
jgi:hypothetical protein